MKHISYFKELNNYRILEQFLNTDQKNIDLNQIVYGNPPIEFKEIIEDKNDPIKNWFEKEGIIDKIIKEAPLNDSETTKSDLDQLIKLTANATGDDITFSRYADDQSNLPNLFIDFLNSKGYEETMDGYFRIDDQTDVILNFLKDVINRPRPYQLAKSYNIPLYPLIRTDAMTAAYPSGHALTAFVMSEHYARKHPEIASEVRDLGKRIARSREVVGIHYPSDTKISRYICSVMFDNDLIK
jgi:acid phosphatase (class A)